MSVCGKEEAQEVLDALRDVPQAPPKDDAQVPIIQYVCVPFP